MLSPRPGHANLLPEASWLLCMASCLDPMEQVCRFVLPPSHTSACSVLLCCPLQIRVLLLALCEVFLGLHSRPCSVGLVITHLPLSFCSCAVVSDAWWSKSSQYCIETQPADFFAVFYWRKGSVSKLFYIIFLSSFASSYIPCSSSVQCSATARLLCSDFITLNVAQNHQMQSITRNSFTGENTVDWKSWFNTPALPYPPCHVWGKFTPLMMLIIMWKDGNADICQYLSSWEVCCAATEITAIPGCCLAPWKCLRDV